MARMPKKRPGQKVDKKGRSVGEPKHVRLYEWMLASQAYQSLSVTARAALVELNRVHNGVNNGEVAMAVRSLASRLGVHKTTANRALWELQEKGFIKVAQPGSFDWKQNMATTYILTQYAANDLPATKDFMHWKSSPEEKSRSH